MNYLKIDSKKDFQKYTDLVVGTAGNEIPTVNTIGYSDLLKALRVSKVSTDTSLFLKINLGLVKVGDVVKFDFEYLSANGFLTLAIDNFTAPDYVTYKSSGISSNARYITYGSSQTFKRKTNNFTIIEEGYAQLVIGIRTADVSDVYIRDFSIQSTAHPIGLPVLKESKRSYVINYNKTSNSFRANAEYTPDKIRSFTIAADRITILHDVPFESAYYSTLFGGLSYNALLANYEVQFRSPARGQFSFVIVDKTTKLAVDHTILNGTNWAESIFLNVHVNGWDYSYS